ncbi:hypothetical protein NW762_008136 [Fusarium torreyae]|uniref:Uncharacterized protein n=1 Tax=Fusarium torreyae TaxID=1237075 RepID=A0A9W8RVR4_9HYPO|nr:hypothetical protein NW762_008136 [Fusarium torreyae]
MVDNADTLDLTNYIPTGGPGTILITTTDGQRATDCHAIGKIGPMNRSNSLELLTSYERPGKVRDETEQSAAERLAVEILGGVPLAIAQAGSYIFNKYCTYTEYCDEIRRSSQEPLSYEVLHLSGHQRHVWGTFKLSISLIQNLNEDGSPQAIELLRVLCFLHHEGIQERMSNGISQRDHGEAVGLMEKVEKVETELVGKDSARTYNTRVELYRIYRIAKEDAKAQVLARAIRPHRPFRDEDVAQDQDCSEMPKETQASSQVVCQSIEGSLNTSRSQEKGDAKGSDFLGVSELSDNQACLNDSHQLSLNMGDVGTENDDDFISQDRKNYFADELLQSDMHYSGDKLLYPSSSEKGGGESGSEASDSSSAM